MATFSNLTKSCKQIFSSLPSLQRKLKNIQNGRSVLHVESGIEYCIDAAIGKKLVESANKNLKLSGNQSPEYIAKLEQILFDCSESLNKCEQNIAETAASNSWTPELEKTMIENWRLFCMGILDATSVLPIVDFNFMLLVGKPEGSMYSKSNVRTSTSEGDEKSQSDRSSHSSWHSKGSFMKIAWLRKEKKDDELRQGESQAGSTSGRSKLQKLPPKVASESGSRSPLKSAGLNRLPIPEPSIPDTAPPSYSDFDCGRSRNPDPRALGNGANMSSMNAAQWPLENFSTTLRDAHPSQGQNFFAQHIHMYHGSPQHQQPGAFPLSNAFPIMPPAQPMLPFIYQPLVSPPPWPPLSYKSSRFSLRETLATGLLDIIKPDIVCDHGVRHYKGHPECEWGCCWHQGCFV